MEVAMSQAAGRGRNSRVLVVEDNEAQLRTLTAILEEEGFDTIGCSTATEALQHVGQEDIAVAIVDLRLPALSGTELLKRFQELGDNVPVVVHTAYASYESAKDAINHGAFAYVEKACDPDEIVYHVRRAFQQHLEQYADELENAVADRTRELQEACEELGCEIDRREQAAEALERSESLLATILETAPAGIGLLHDRVFQWVNIPMLEMTGYREDELLGQNVQMLYETAGEYERVGRVKYARIRATGTGEIDTQWRRKDGTSIHVHLQSTAIAPADISAGVIFTATDITERKQAEQALRVSEEKYRSIFENSPEMIVLIDAQGTLLETNGRAHEWLGYSNEDFRGKHFSRLSCWSEKDKARLRDLLSRRIAGDQIPPYELEFIREDGSTLPCRVHGTAVKNAAGNAPHVLMIVSDVSVQKETEKALRGARDRAQRYLDIARVMFVALDEEGNITLLNQRAGEILGCREEDLVGKNWFDTCLPETIRNTVFDVYRKLMAGEIEPVEYYENPVLTQQGEQRLIAWRNTVLHSDEGRIVGTLSSGADITERRLAEDQRRNLEAELAHIGRVHTVGEMAASLAHEINQPLYAIANYVRGTKRRVKRGSVSLDQVTEVMSSVSDEVDRAAGIISHLREFVRKGQPRRTAVDVKELVEDVMRLLEPDIRQNRITVHLRLDVRAPAVSADPVQIQQVAVNLIRNAIDAMSELPASERILSLAAKCTKEEAIEIAVADTGKGLSPDIADNVFEAFFTTKDDGLGIGLAISRTIVEAHGGRLWTVPNRPQGAVFCFTIPLQNGKADDELAAYRVSRG